MALTEKEVEALMEDVGEVDWSDPVMVTWLENSLADNRTLEKQIRGRLVVAKMMRDDNQMKAAKEQLDRVRQLIGVLEELQEQGEA